MDHIDGNLIRKLLPFHYHVKSIGVALSAHPPMGLATPRSTYFGVALSGTGGKIKSIVPTKGSGSFSFIIFTKSAFTPAVKVKKAKEKKVEEVNKG